MNSPYQYKIHLPENRVDGKEISCYFRFAWYRI